MSDGEAGVVGLGAMGGPVARYLVTAGRDLWCVDPDLAAPVGLVARGACSTPLPELAAGVESCSSSSRRTRTHAPSASAGSVVAVFSSVLPQTFPDLGCGATPVSWSSMLLSRAGVRRRGGSGRTARGRGRCTGTAAPGPDSREDLRSGRAGAAPCGHGGAGRPLDSAELEDLRLPRHAEDLANRLSAGGGSRPRASRRVGGEAGDARRDRSEHRPAACRSPRHAMPQVTTS
jgi:hypothetical protein